MKHSVGHPPTLTPAGRGGAAAGFQKPKERAHQTRATLFRLWTYLRKDSAVLTGVLLSIIAATALAITGPYLMKIAIDEHLMGTIQYPKLALLICAMMLVHLISAALTFVQQWLMIGVSQRSICRLREDLFAQFQRLPIPFFDSRSTGEVMSRMSNDVENISQNISSGFLEMISALLSLFVVAIVMFVINWRLALICLCVIPLVLMLTKKMASYTRIGYRDRQQHLGELNGIIEENISGHEVVHAFAKESEVLKHFERKNSDFRAASIKATIASGLMGPMMNTMNNLNYGVTAFAGGLLALHGLVSIGSIAAFLTYTKQFARPLNQIAQLYNSIQSAIAGAERVFAIMDEPSEFDESADDSLLNDVRGEVTFNHVHFQYQENVPILKGVYLHAKPGQTIALVGPTGAGKTTIINLLTRFYELQQGSITIDGTDISHISKVHLRKVLGIVLQETFLFSDSVRENIRYGNLGASDEEVEAAATMAMADVFILRMPQGYDTMISENGENLSQGQRQLIAIARVILSDPSILVLDEATSSVDTRTEVHIQQGMLALMQGRTSFVIAHRLSTIKNADQILVMRDGCIAEQGTHRELMQRQSFYRELYQQQFALDFPEPCHL